MLTLRANFLTVTDGQVVTVNENQNLEIECISSNSAVDVTLTTDPPEVKTSIVTGAPASAQNFTLPNVNRTLNETVFTCSINTGTVSFSIEVQCK